MHKSKKQVTNFSYNQEDGIFSNSLVLVMFSGLGVMTLIFAVFLLLNIFVKQSLIDSNAKITNLLHIKRTQESDIKNKKSTIDGLSKKLNLTDKDLKDRIKTNKYLSSNLNKEKKQKEDFKESLSSLEEKHSKALQIFESSEKTFEEIFLELEMEKEQHDVLQSKYKVLIGEYDLNIKETTKLNKLLDSEEKKYKVLQKKYLENIDYLEGVENENEDMLRKYKMQEDLSRKLKNQIDDLKYDLEVININKN